MPISKKVVSDLPPFIIDVFPLTDKGGFLFRARGVWVNGVVVIKNLQPDEQDEALEIAEKILLTAACDAYNAKAALMEALDYDRLARASVEVHFRAEFDGAKLSSYLFKLKSRIMSYSGLSFTVSAMVKKPGDGGSVDTNVSVTVLFPDDILSTASFRGLDGLATVDDEDLGIIHGAAWHARGFTVSVSSDRGDAALLLNGAVKLAFKNAEVFLERSVRECREKLADASKGELNPEAIRNSEEAFFAYAVTAMMESLKKEDAETVYRLAMSMLIKENKPPIFASRNPFKILFLMAKEGVLEVRVGGDGTKVLVKGRDVSEFMKGVALEVAEKAASAAVALASPRRGVHERRRTHRGVEQVPV